MRAKGRARVPVHDPEAEQIRTFPCKMTESVYAKVVRIANVDGTTRTEIIRRAIDMYVEYRKDVEHE